MPTWNFGFDSVFIDRLQQSAQDVFGQFSPLVYLAAGIILALSLARMIFAAVADWLDPE